MTDFYEALDIPKDATTADIKSAYRKKAKTEHPDAGGSAERFSAIEKAYRVLSDEDRRAKYDETGETEENDEGAMVRQAVDGVMAEVMENFDPEQDLMKAALQVIDAKLSEIRGSKAKTNQKVERLEKALSRIKKDTEKVVSSLMQSRAKALKRDIALLEQAERVVGRAREIVSKVEYEADESDEYGTDWLMKPIHVKNRSFFSGA